MTAATIRIASGIANQIQAGRTFRQKPARPDACRMSFSAGFEFNKHFGPRTVLFEIEANDFSVKRKKVPPGNMLASGNCIRNRFGFKQTPAIQSSQARRSWTWISATRRSRSGFARRRSRRTWTRAAAAKLRAFDLVAADLLGVNVQGIRRPGMASCVMRMATSFSEWITSRNSNKSARAC